VAIDKKVKKDIAQFDFTSVGLIRRMLKSRLFQASILLPSLLIFMVLIWVGFVGTPVGAQNAAIMVVWIFWFGLLAILLIPFGGRLWCMLCPLPSPGEWLSRRTVVRRAKKVHTLGLKWPLRLDNIWLQNIGFLVIASFSPIILTRPAATSIILIVFIFLAIGLALIFTRRGRGGRIFCRFVCPIGGMIGLYSLLGGLEVKAKDREQCRRCREKYCSKGSDEAYPCPWFNYPGSFSPCRTACPAGVNSDIYIDLISQGKFKEALEVHRQTMPFAGVCGRICTHPCELSCERANVDGPVSIRSLKRFMADYELKVGREKAVPVEKTKTDRVAVIGSGPAGLACAYDLVRQGYPVTVFEAAPLAGGLLRYGIPEYRLPKEILDNEISFIEETGVEIKTDTMVKNAWDIFSQGYKAVFIGVGAGTSQKLGIPGEDSKGVIHALDFLNQANSGVKVDLGERVVVIGGGNAAIDAASVARRLGTGVADTGDGYASVDAATMVHRLGAKDVSIIYRRSRAEMPAIRSEVEEAEREGVKLHLLTAPVEILSENGRLTGLRCIKMELGEPDASGRRRPVPIAGSEFDMDVDSVIVAIGQAVDKSALPQELEYTNWETVAINPLTLQTNVDGVFAGGDVVAGPANVIEVIAEGKEAAISIDRYLSGQDLIEGRPPPVKQVAGVATAGVAIMERDVMPVLAPEKRGTFEEVELGFSEKMAIDEASRCFKCGAGMERNIYCGLCTECITACPHDNISFRTRLFGKDLLKHRKMDEAFKSFIMLGSGILFATIFFGWWSNLKDIADPLESTLLRFSINWSEWGLYVLMVWGSILVVLPGIHLLFSWLAKKAAKAKEVPLKRLFVDYAYTLIPMGLAVWIGFGIGMLMIQGSLVVSSISDPLGWGWDLFGTADYPWRPYAPHLVPFIQGGLLLLGLAGSTYTGWKLSLQNFGAPGRALRAMVPMGVFLVGLTIVLMYVFAVI
jgi:NADPH-dependent glutamate synthase beta subunit-like oxidoreductase